MAASNTLEIVSVMERPAKVAQQDETTCDSHPDTANPEIIQTAKEMSKHIQADVLSIFLPIGAAIIAGCIALVAWLAIHGPALVPGQDTRITSIIISFGSRVLSVIMTTAILRSAWACFLPTVLHGSNIPVWSLLSASQGFMSFSQLSNFTSLPPWFKFHVCLVLTVFVTMIGTSASFRYESLPQIGPNTAYVADVASICNVSFLSNGGYGCAGNPNYSNWNTNTTANSWGYIEQVNAGGQGTITKYGQIGDFEIGSNVTLAILPLGWSIEEDNLPWMSMSVSCTDLKITADFEGYGISATANIYVNGTLIDILNVPNMPEWNSVVHMYQQYNDSGPLSSLSPWIAVMLSRDLDDAGGTDMAGVADDAVTFLGNGVVALHGVGNGTIVQSIVGAAAYCELSGDVGGKWPDIFWPPLNDTRNVVFGPVVNDRPAISTVLLNYGPSWQYSFVGQNDIDGATVSYIANNTGLPGTFAALFAGYIKNQWTLMAYSLVPQTEYRLPTTFIGLGPNSLYITVTSVIVLPLVALGLGFLVTVYASVSTFRHRKWVNRVEFESWWLVKALSPELYRPGYGNATQKDMKDACSGFSVRYGYSKAERQDVGNLHLWAAAPGQARGNGEIDSNYAQMGVSKRQL